MRTALRRARRLGAFLLLALSVWVLVRRRSAAVTWVEPAEPSGPAGPAGDAAVDADVAGLPDDVLATDAGLTELPAEAVLTDDSAAAEVPAGTVDDALVAELLAESPDAEVIVVDEHTFEEAVAGATEPPSTERPSTEPPSTEAPSTEPPSNEAPAAGATPTGEAGLDDEETSTEIVMPTFSEAPTMEIPAVSDNLRAVRGIGPSMERMLHGLGIISYRQLAMLDGAELERVRAELGDFRSRIERENWVGQARELHKEKYGREPR